ncbi:MAG: hypothetical protein QY326_04455 [Bdellovibrionota bacterium]|nr:MAG: hypothetical protein QY326_04455 [Bdellovibrionota bacterium]
MGRRAVYCRARAKRCVHGAGWLLFLQLLLLIGSLMPQSSNAAPSNPIVFVTQPPWPQDFGTANATFGNHLATMAAVPRGGDLYIRYPNGTLKNLTQAAGYGQSGLQGAQAIAVRDPSVHWDGQKVIFSMVVGAPAQQYEVNEYRWQLYEVTGLGQGETPVIAKVPNQPEEYNNVSPTYGTDDRIIFTSDRPRGGEPHLYPQRDEYESFPTNTGLWSLDPVSGDLKILDHAPSGDFNPFVDSFGRIIFTRWDHMQRDQQNRCSQPSFEAFNYASEAADAARLDDDTEVYPEPRADCDADADSSLGRHRFNHFLPWQVNESGEEMETLNHIGRHELVSYIPATFTDDANVIEYYGQYSRVNQNSIENFFQIAEDAALPGRYYGVNAPEFGTHASGQLVYIDGAPSLPADQMQVTYVTHEDTAGTDDTPSVHHIGMSRDPLPMSNGELIAAHAATTRQDTNIGTSSNPASRYDFRLKTFVPSGGVKIPGTTLTSGITKTLSFWSPDSLISFNNVTMWELQPKEVVARTRPAARTTEVPAPEQAVFDAEGVSVESLKDYLRENNLALVVSRNVTRRDELDRQQPINLQVEGSDTQTIPESGKVYSVAHMQFFEGLQVRGYGGTSNPSAGRRVLAQIMRSIDSNPENPSGPAGSVAIAADGSMAAFVPAQRALTYQMTDASGKGIVRERLWLTFQPGEIRVCASCHGINSKDHQGNSGPQNEPDALRALLQQWRDGPQGGDDDLTLSVRTAKGGARSATSRQKLRLRVESSAQNEGVQFSIQATVGKTDCGELFAAETESSGTYTRAFRAPKVSKRMPIRFSVVVSGEEESSARVTVRPNGSVLPRRSPAAVCAQLQKL